MSSNEIQPNPVETSTLPRAEPPVVQPTALETITTTNNNTLPQAEPPAVQPSALNNNSNTAATTLNKSNKEVDRKNNIDNSPENAAQFTPTNHGERQMECRCSGIWDFFCRKPTVEEGPSSAGGPDNSHRTRVDKLQKNLEEIAQQLDLLEKFLGSPSQKELRDHLGKLNQILNENKEQEARSTGTKTPAWIPKISKEIMKFKQQISSTDKLYEKLSLSADLQSSTGSKGGSGVHELGNVHQSASFSRASFYNEIADIFEGLDKREQFFLSCFTVFPENAVVKRRIFVYWGLGEGMLDTPGTNGKSAVEALQHSSGAEEKNTVEASSDASVTEDKDKNTPEEIVDRILEEFQEKGLIEAITKKRKRREHVKSYKMHPLVRSAVIQIPKPAGFFDYDNKGNVLPQRDWASSDSDPPKVVENVLLPHCGRMCLLKAEEREQFLERKPSGTTKEMKKLTQISDTYLESVVTLFNVNEPFPDLELAWLTKLKDKNNVGQLNKEPSAEDWLSKMKNAQVVCLGSWPGSAKPHIEVESIEFLEGLKSSKYLRFLSLQGISRITELPDSIGKHSKLVILDLKECHNLEMLPEEITKLKELRYLDLSDCFLLARMPKGLGALSELVVLKGFVISNPPRKNSGTLNDLKGLKKLRKLTINASSEEFPTEKDLDALQELGKNALRKLTIAWGAEPNKADPKTEVPKNGNAAKQTPKCLHFLLSPLAPTTSETKVISPTPTLMKLPEELKKLDLQCFPKSTATWLTPDLPNLEKLYIRGGNLATLDLNKSEWSKVKTLRLKYLCALKMNWRELRKSFPKLEYFEKVKCPGITLCPCDQHGVWMTDES